jgi:hypothetical protein
MASKHHIFATNIHSNPFKVSALEVEKLFLNID